MSDTRTMEVDEVGRIILYEVTIQVRALCVRMLFNSSPTLGQICDIVSHIFANNQEVELGILNLLLSIGDDEDRRNTTFKVGDDVKFVEDSQEIGFINLQTRTLFDA